MCTCLALEVLDEAPQHVAQLVEHRRRGGVRRCSARARSASASAVAAGAGSLASTRPEPPSVPGTLDVGATAEMAEAGVRVQVTTGG